MGSIYKRGEVYWLKYYNGRTIRESAKTNKESIARRRLKDREAQVRTKTFPGLRVERIRFEELATDFLTHYRIKRKKSIRTAEIFVDTLTKHFGGRRVIDISTADVEAVIEIMQGEGYADASINRHLSALKRMFSLGASQTPPKVLRVPYMPTLPENNTRTGFFDHEEFLALRGVLPNCIKPVVTIAYYTGFRREEILSLRWDQVDLERRRIVLNVGTTKNKEGRVAYMPEDLHRVLVAWKKYRDGLFYNYPLVCFRVEGDKPAPLGDFRKSWRKACDTVGLSGMILHDFRRTAVRNMVRAGILESVAMKISGHKTRAMFLRYNITDERDIAEAAGKLDSFYSARPISGHNLGTISEATLASVGN